MPKTISTSYTNAKFLNFYCNLFLESFQQMNKKIKIFRLILLSSILMVSHMEIFWDRSDTNQSLSKIEHIWYRIYDRNFGICQNDDLDVIQKYSHFKIVHGWILIHLREIQWSSFGENWRFKHIFKWASSVTQIMDRHSNHWTTKI